MIRRYSELIRIPSYEDRFEYLRLHGRVGVDTFGFDRVFNQMFYHSKEWKRLRRDIIIRDYGGDMAMRDWPINGLIFIHHMNPITLNDLESQSDYLMNPEYLVCVSYDTHNAIHYGDKHLLRSLPIERTPNDTCPWKR